MEDRTEFSYGTKKVLSTSDINYMISIVNSELSDKERALKLYSYCNYSNILSSYDFYKKFQPEEVKSLSILKIVYEQYDKQGYFELSKNPYKCNLQEIEVRLEKINKVFDVINSNDSDYKKAEKLCLLYSTAEKFRRSYALFVKFGSKDDRLDYARVALDNFDVIYSKYIEYENTGILANVNYVLKFREYFENYRYAGFVINNYISSLESYREFEFLSELGIDKNIFDFCVNVIMELDVDLYNKYLDKKNENNRKRFFNNSVTIKNLAVGIRTGLLPNGVKFNLLEFIKRVPFKYSKNFVYAIEDFMLRNNMDEYNTIMNYIVKNKLNLATSFAPLNLKSIYQVKTIVNGIEITAEDNDLIIEYLKQNDIPVIAKTYILIREKYLNGQIDIEKIKKKQEKLKNIKSKVLIPSIK